jgi:hypothetical protein
MYNIFDTDSPVHHDGIFDKEYPIHHEEHEVLPKASLSGKNSIEATVARGFEQLRTSNIGRLLAALYPYEVMLTYDQNHRSCKVIVANDLYIDISLAPEDPEHPDKCYRVDFHEKKMVDGLWQFVNTETFNWNLDDLVKYILRNSDG